MADQTYTLAEVAVNNGKKDARTWIIIRGYVYDVTEWLEKHPGGPNVIAEYAGRDATKAFNQAGHPSDALRELKNYKIGTLVKETQTYTVAEVAVNNGKKDARTWIIIRGYVYDVTEWLEKHPGGPNVIAEYAGRDATKAFNQAGHPSDALRELKNYKIGTLVKETQPAATNNNNSNSTNLETSPSQTAEQTYTLDEVAVNNGNNDAQTWIIIRGYVYDVTEWLEKHPGGPNVIAEYAGRDATKAFNQAGHSSDAQRDLKNYKIGTLVIQTQPTATNKNDSNSINPKKSSSHRKCCFCF